jgi:hypothetical protein
MKARCQNPNTIKFKNYGGRGIAVCERWLDFENFLEDMGEPPVGRSIDRIDNNRGYSPDNCRWATTSEQVGNQRSNINICFRGQTKTLSEWAIELEMVIATLYARLVIYKWDVEDAMTRPVQPHVVLDPCTHCGAKHFAKGLCERCYGREGARRRRMKVLESRSAQA